MAKRADSQKIGAKGHKWVMLQIEEHADWLSRDLNEDFGVDAEAELTLNGVNGEILKLQFKTSLRVPKKHGRIKFAVERKYFEYARTCRYPVIYIRIDLSKKLAWYLWLQDWILKERAKGNRISASKKQFIAWIDDANTLSSGLDSYLKDVAAWRGETQLVLSLLDALHAGVATYNPDLVGRLVALLTDAAPLVADASVEVVLQEAVYLGNRLRGTAEGLATAQQLYVLIRKFGNRMTTSNVDMMVRRGKSYSRVGLDGLGILYDDHFDHAVELDLAKHFVRVKLPEVAYYCALRVANPTKRYFDFLEGPGKFEFEGLRFDCPPDVLFSNKYANRGPSAILDYLVPVEST
jgi:hypothetical protein